MSRFPSWIGGCLSCGHYRIKLSALGPNAQRGDCERSENLVSDLVIQGSGYSGTSAKLTNQLYWCYMIGTMWVPDSLYRKDRTEQCSGEQGQSIQSLNTRNRRLAYGGLLRRIRS